MDRCLTGAAGLPCSWCCASLRPPPRAAALPACRSSERARRSPLASRERRRQSVRLDTTAPDRRARRACRVAPLRASVEEDVAPARAGPAPAAPARTATARGEDAAAFDASQQSASKWAFFTAELVAVLGIMYAVRGTIYAARGIMYARAGCPVFKPANALTRWHCARWLSCHASLRARTCKRCAARSARGARARCLTRRRRRRAPCLHVRTAPHVCLHASAACAAGARPRGRALAVTPPAPACAGGVRQHQACGPLLRPSRLPHLCRRGRAPH